MPTRTHIPRKNFSLVIHTPPCHVDLLPISGSKESQVYIGWLSFSFCHLTRARLGQARPERRCSNNMILVNLQICWMMKFFVRPSSSLCWGGGGGRYGLLAALVGAVLLHFQTLERAGTQTTATEQDHGAWTQNEVHFLPRYRARGDVAANEIGRKLSIVCAVTNLAAQYFYVQLTVWTEIVGCFRTRSFIILSNASFLCCLGRGGELSLKFCPLSSFRLQLVSFTARNQSGVGKTSG